MCFKKRIKHYLAVAASLTGYPGKPVQAIDRVCVSLAEGGAPAVIGTLEQHFSLLIVAQVL
mgnify:CR=1 FL=1